MSQIENRYRNNKADTERMGKHKDGDRKKIHIHIQRAGNIKLVRQRSKCKSWTETVQYKPKIGTETKRQRQKDIKMSKR